MTSRIGKKLEQLGLSDKEAAVYVASLESGPATVVDLAEKTGVKRPTVYVAIEALTKIGLMSSVMQGKKTLFTAEDPANLERLIQKAKEDVSEREEALKSLSPELSLLFNNRVADRPVVRFFSGVDGIDSIRRDIVASSKGEILSFTDLDSLFKIFPRQNSLTNSRVEKNIKSRVLYTADEFYPWVEDATALRRGRFIPRAKYPFEGDITIFGDKVVISSFKGKPEGILIEHPEMAKMLRFLFDLAWESAATEAK
ncbi:MAG: helix-turn-helix domain-containing protein [bacterium]|nr:helix-turn-helix domain-containing protein [bacterium]